MIIYDIGANRGAFTSTCLRVYPNSHVVMVEANDDLVKELEANFSKESVTILNRAVSDISDVEIDFFIGSSDYISTASLRWINNSRFTNDVKWDKHIRKLTINIDNIIKKFPNPDIIKIDVEGYELNVIKGLTSKQKKICLEWAEEQYDEIIKIFDYLENLGYNQFGFIEKDDYLKEPDIWTDKISCIKNMNMIPERKQKWGMIWVK